MKTRLPSADAAVGLALEAVLELEAALEPGVVLVAAVLHSIGRPQAARRQ